MKFFLSLLILSLALLSVCTKSQKQESKPVAVSIDTIPTIVDTIRRGFFGDDKLARIYYGTVCLGVNLHEAAEDWLTIDKL